MRRIVIALAAAALSAPALSQQKIEVKVAEFCHCVGSCRATQLFYFIPSQRFSLAFKLESHCSTLVPPNAQAVLPAQQRCADPNALAFGRSAPAPCWAARLNEEKQALKRLLCQLSEWQRR